jgi:purine nucleosidase
MMDMKSIPVLQKLVLLIFSLFIGGIEVSGETLQRISPIKVIIDTDLDSDVDDVGALAMLYNLHHAGIIELLGVIVTSDDPYAPVCASALNTYYELPKLPVGYLKGQPELKHHSRYTKQIAEEFPSSMKTWEEAEDAVELYRSILAENPDESVVVVTVGHLSSLQGLLQSESDGISDLNGKKLAHKKIREWICMGGQYPEGKEANFYRPDPASTVYCINNWEKEVIFCGWEAGTPVITGGNWLKEKLVPGHPVYRGYELYNNFAGRQSWDQIAVLQLFPQGRKYFTSVKGNCIVASDGSNTWEHNKQGRHRYVVLEPDTGLVKQLIDNLMAGEMAFLKQ